MAKTALPDELPSFGWSYGVPVSYLQGITEYWHITYDWREQEA